VPDGGGGAALARGFACPVCGGRQGTRLSTRPKIQCTSCRHQASSTAGTIFASTKLPLTRWFLAIRLIATAAEGITSVELGRRLGIKQTNAWALKRKLLRAMEHDDWRSPGDRRSRKRKLLPAKAVPRKATARPPVAPSTIWSPSGRATCRRCSRRPAPDWHHPLSPPTP